MCKKENNGSLLDLILRYPPEIPMMRKSAKHYDRIREKDFFRKMAFWVFPSLDSTYFALQTLALLRDDDNSDDINLFINKFENAIKDFVFSCYDKNTGGFFQTYENKYPTLHATHCMVGLVKSFLALRSAKPIDHSKPITKEEIRVFEEISGFKRNKIDLCASISRFAKSCYDDRTGGFFEMPKELLKENNLIRSTSVNNTASALWCAFHFEEDICSFMSEKRFDIIENVYNFINIHKVIEDDKVAYLNFIDDESPWICSTYYAERSLRNLKKLLSDEEIEGIMRFIISIKWKNSGFCAGNSKGSNLDVNIIHTKDSMSLLRRYYLNFNTITRVNGRSFDSNEFMRNVCRDVTRYLEKTYVMGGFATAEKQRYLPNIYSTRLAYDIIEYIISFSKNLGLNQPNFDFLNKKETIKYLLSCYDEQSGAFRGYSKDKKYIIKEYVKGFFGMAA